MSKSEFAKIEFRDPVVRRVVEQFVDRSNEGFAKYGRSLDGERRGGHTDLVGYLNDIQEELMDAVLYIQAAREELSDLREDELVRKLKENYGEEAIFED